MLHDPTRITPSYTHILCTPFRLKQTCKGGLHCLSFSYLHLLEWQP